MATILHGQTRGPELTDDLAEKVRRRGQIIKVISAGGVVLIDLRQLLAEMLISLWVLQIAAQIIEPAEQVLPAVGLDLDRGKVLDILIDLVAELLRTERSPPDADH